jgi:hypothetical protein
MKLIISFVLSTILFIQHVKSQTLALDRTKDTQGPMYYSAANFIGYTDHKDRKVCVTTIVGISSLTVGVGMTIGGLAMEWGAGSEEERSAAPDKEATYHRARNTAMAITGAGIVLGVAGFGMTIAGGIHDHIKHNRRWSIAAPKKNEIGFAYNF